MQDREKKAPPSRLQSFSFIKRQCNILFFAGAILNSSILPASAVHPSSETEEIKGRLEVHLKMNEDHEDHNVMTMGLFIKACVHKTCIFKRKVFDETPIPGQSKSIISKWCVAENRKKCQVFRI